MRIQLKKIFNKSNLLLIAVVSIVICSCKSETKKQPIEKSQDTLKIVYPEVAE
jgi:hypothetical protein